ncbi:MAG: PocR ligand-binding domain-containing protein [Clostridia bacterium]|nr:PocR ligand-binding domain-containing protein [Clostridia bacterium]
MDYILDKKKLCDLVESFYSIAKIKVVILDKDFHGIVSYPKEECAFCAKLRQNKTAIECCKACEIKNGHISKETNKLNIYKCHIGLTEAISPIKIGNVHIGYIMLGQVLDSEEKESMKEKILTSSEKFTNENMEKYYSAINTKTKSEIKAATKILEACASYLVMQEVIKENPASIAFKITNYINDNLSRNITVELLCNEFYLSRNTLYKIFYEYFETTVAKYVRKKRVERAVELIESGVSISNVLPLVGFNDFSYFSKVIKKETGRLPREIKKRH